MPLEKQVVSLELAKKLKELGMKQESLFEWVRDDDNDEWCCVFTDDYDYHDFPCYAGYKQKVAAFTVAELGEMLAPLTRSGRSDSQEAEEKYYCRHDETKHITYAITEADARAKMLIYLIENDLI